MAQDPMVFLRELLLPQPLHAQHRRHRAQALRENGRCPHNTAPGQATLPVAKIGAKTSGMVVIAAGKVASRSPDNEEPSRQEGLGVAGYSDQ